MAACRRTAAAAALILALGGPAAHAAGPAQARMTIRGYVPVSCEAHARALSATVISVRQRCNTDHELVLVYPPDAASGASLRYAGRDIVLGAEGTALLYAGPPMDTTVPLMVDAPAHAAEALLSHARVLVRPR